LSYGGFFHEIGSCPTAWYDDRKKRTVRNQPEDRIMGGISVLVLSLSMAVTQDKRVGPAEQYRAILKFGEAAHANWKATTDEERKQAAARGTTPAKTRFRQFLNFGGFTRRGITLSMEACHEIARSSDSRFGLPGRRVDHRQSGRPG
jgi:hypothetical protein